MKFQDDDWRDTGFTLQKPDSRGKSLQNNPAKCDDCGRYWYMYQHQTTLEHRAICSCDYCDVCSSRMTKTRSWCKCKKTKRKTSK